MKSVILLALSFMSISPAMAAAGSEALLEKIIKSPAYASHAKAQYGSNEKYLACFNISEVQTSKVYDALRGEEGTWKYKFVVLECSFNPHDGGDAIQKVGLAVLSPGEVLSFVTNSIPQAD